MRSYSHSANKQCKEENHRTGRVNLISAPMSQNNISNKNIRTDFTDVITKLKFSERILHENEKLSFT